MVKQNSFRPEEQTTATFYSTELQLLYTHIHMDVNVHIANGLRCIVGLDLKYKNI